MALWLSGLPGSQPIRSPANAAGFTCVVKAAGIEPASIKETTETKAGQIKAHPGREESQVGHHAGVTPASTCKTRTAPGQNGSNPGQSQNTTSTQRTHLRNEIETIADAWPRLPKFARKGIIAMVKALDQ